MLRGMQAWESLGFAEKPFDPGFPGVLGVLLQVSGRAEQLGPGQAGPSFTAAVTRSPAGQD